MFWSSWGQHQAVIMIKWLKLFELPNMDPYLVQFVHTIKLSIDWNTGKYNINTLNIKIILRHYAASWKVTGLSPGWGGFFNLPNPSSRTITLESTQPLTKWVPGIFLGVKSGQHIGLTTLSPSNMAHKMVTILKFLLSPADAWIPEIVLWG
jgi:hypothetical protein